MSTARLSTGLLSPNEIALGRSSHGRPQHADYRI